jgi:hypothetical protein
MAAVADKATVVVVDRVMAADTTNSVRRQGTLNRRSVETRWS